MPEQSQTAATSNVDNAADENSDKQNISFFKIDDFSFRALRIQKGLSLLLYWLATNYSWPVEAYPLLCCRQVS